MSVRSAFAIQAEACEALGSPFTASLCRRLGSHLDRSTEVGRLCLDWQGDPGPSADSIPLRLCGGFHALVLTGRDGQLAKNYPPTRAVAPEWNDLEAALINHQDFLLDWMQSPPQTNEVSRSAVIWPAMMTLASLIDVPLRLMEVGASGGLNLQMDRYSYRLGPVEAGQKESRLQLSPEWQGNAPVSQHVEIASRLACDINPLDPSTPQDALRLRAYCWPDQEARLARLDAALAIASQNPVKVEKIDAIEWLTRELAEPAEGICRVIYSTIAWQYLPQEAREQGETLILQAATAQAKPTAPLAWIRFEADGKTPGASIRLQLWPHNLDVNLGRADFHGRWIDWHGLSH